MIVTKEDIKKLPPYIIVGEGGCAMRLSGFESHGEYQVNYYRDGGAWGYDDFKIEDDGRIIGLWDDDVLNGKELIPTTYEYWLKDNGPYGNGYRAFNDNIEPKQPILCCDDEEKNGWSSHCKTCGKPIVI